GPAMLQISNFWQPGETVMINWLPGLADVAGQLQHSKRQTPTLTLDKWLQGHFPQRLAQAFSEHFGWQEPLQRFDDSQLEKVAYQLEEWAFKPAGTEGYRTAEVTIGGVDTGAVSSKTFEAKTVPGLHFIGEVLDVTGQLGGFNFQWAWASAHAAASHL